MREHEGGPAFSTEQLTRDFAEQHATRLAQLAREVPGSDYTEAHVLAEEIPGHQLRGKWDHSLVLTEGERPIGMALGWEREADGSREFPENSIHLSVLAVDRQYRGQGYGKLLLTQFMAGAIDRGFTELDGDIIFSLKTSADPDNEPVRRFYEGHFGFVPVGVVEAGDDHFDVVMRTA